MLNKKFKKALVLSVGVIFTILGLLGLVLPFLQGILFLAVGVILLSFTFPKTRLWINKHTEKSPRLFAIINKFEAWILKFIGEM